MLPIAAAIGLPLAGQLYAHSLLPKEQVMPAHLQGQSQQAGGSASAQNTQEKSQESMEPASYMRPVKLAGQAAMMGVELVKDPPKNFKDMASFVGKHADWFRETGDILGTNLYPKVKNYFHEQPATREEELAEFEALLAWLEQQGHHESAARLRAAVAEIATDERGDVQLTDEVNMQKGRNALNILHEELARLRNPGEDQKIQNSLNPTTPLLNNQIQVNKYLEQRQADSEAQRASNADQLALMSTTRDYTDVTLEPRLQDGLQQMKISTQTRGDDPINDIRFTKLVADSAMLKANQLQNPLISPMHPSQAKLAYDLAPKLMHNQKVVLPQPQTMRDMDYVAQKKVITPFLPLLEVQRSFRERVSRLDGSAQTQGPERPITTTSQSCVPLNLNQEFTTSTLNSQEGKRKMQTEDTIRYPVHLTQNYLTNNLRDEWSKRLFSNLHNDMLPVEPANKMIKIVGDDVPAGTSDTTTSVVGNDLASSGQLTAANAAMNNSVIFDILAKVVMIEQTLLSEFGIREGLRSVNIINEIVNQMNSIPVLYKFVQHAISNQLPGSRFCGLNSRGTNDSLLETGNITWVTCTIPKYVDQAVPLVGNVTMQQLGDLMSNTTIGEFASLLRVNTRSNNLDTLSMIMAKGYNPIVMKTGYSFSAKLAKLLGYLMSLVATPCRDEIEIQTMGRCPVGMDPGASFGATWFNDNIKVYGPGDHAFPFLSQAQGDEFDAKTFTVGLMGYSTYADMITNRFDRSPLTAVPAVTGINPYDPKYWGNEIAVIFVRSAELQTPQLLFTRILSNVEYPMARLIKQQFDASISKTGVILTNASSTILGGNNNMEPWTSCARIIGPNRGVCFVVSDIEVVPVGTPIGLPNIPAVPAAYPANVLGISSSALKASFNSYIGSDPINALTEGIRDWEEKYGNNSDRSSAMRWVAENAKMYGHPIVTSVTPAGTVYDGISICGRREPVLGNDNNIYNNILDYATYPNADKDATGIATTPLGLQRMRWKQDGNLRATPNTPGTSRTNYGDSPHYSLGTSTHVIDFLIDRSWARPWEEYPAARLYDAGKISMCINEMADCMAGMTDLLVQVNSVDVYTFFTSDRYLDTNISVNTSRYMTNVVNRALRQIPATGIQYPAFATNYLAYDLFKYTNHYTFENLFALAEWDVTENKCAAFARLSAGELAKCSRALVHTDPQISFGQWANTYSVMRFAESGTYGVTNKRMQNAILLESTVPSIMWEARKLSFAVVPKETGLPFPALNGRMTGASKELWLPISRPGTWARQYNVFRAALYVGDLGLLGSFPLGCFIPHKNFGLGGDTYFLTMRGPRDAFAKGTKTSAIATVIYFGNTDSIVSAPIMNEFSQIGQLPGDLMTASGFL
jgi:hypothetical protein